MTVTVNPANPANQMMGVTTMRITYFEQLENLHRALANADGEADYAAGLACRIHPTHAEELWNLDFELRRLMERVVQLQAQTTPAREPEPEPGAPHYCEHCGIARCGIVLCECTDPDCVCGQCNTAQSDPAVDTETARDVARQHGWED
ncbi:MAG TPA: hypothetical protein VKQ30_23295 [Ktedonobacterales bacterium]|nr:hypothetical protein [Ktedonobacterales bacterium]